MASYWLACNSEHKVSKNLRIKTHELDCYIAIYLIFSGLRKIYFVTEVPITWPGVYENNVHNNGHNLDEEDEGHESDGSEDAAVTEFWIQPEANEIVDEIFNAMKQCQSMHPDPADSISEDEDYMEAEDADYEDGNADGDGDGARQMRNLNLEGK